MVEKIDLIADVENPDVPGVELQPELASPVTNIGTERGDTAAPRPNDWNGDLGPI
jgi:hypothetical protein